MGPEFKDQVSWDWRLKSHGTRGQAEILMVVVLKRKLSSPKSHGTGDQGLSFMGLVTYEYPPPPNLKGADSIISKQLKYHLPTHI